MTEATGHDVTIEQAVEALNMWSEAECNRCHQTVAMDGGRWSHSSPDAECFGAIEGDITERRTTHSIAVGGSFAIGADNDYEGALEEIRASSRRRLKLPSRPGDHNLAILVGQKWRLYQTNAMTELPHEAE